MYCCENVNTLLTFHWQMEEIVFSCCARTHNNGAYFTTLSRHAAKVGKKKKVLDFLHMSKVGHHAKMEGGECINIADCLHYLSNASLSLLPYLFSVGFRFECLCTFTPGNRMNSAVLHSATSPTHPEKAGLCRGTAAVRHLHLFTIEMIVLFIWGFFVIFKYLFFQWLNDYITF